MRLKWFLAFSLGDSWLALLAGAMKEDPG